MPLPDQVAHASAVFSGIQRNRLPGQPVNALIAPVHRPAIQFRCAGPVPSLPALVDVARRLRRQPSDAV